MISNSQNGEDLKIAEWFGDYTANLLSLGENSGTFLSNAALFIKAGWSATLVEASPKAFDQLQDLYKFNEKVYCINKAVGDRNEEIEFYDSKTHLQKGDIALLSTASQSDYNKWKPTTEFEKIKVPMVTFDKILEESPYKTFDFISSDIEGFDLIVLRQMDLNRMGVKVLCIEHNGDQKALEEIRVICELNGLTNELLINAENIVLTV